MPEIQDRRPPDIQELFPGRPMWPFAAGCATHVETMREGKVHILWKREALSFLLKMTPKGSNGQISRLAHKLGSEIVWETVERFAIAISENVAMFVIAERNAPAVCIPIVLGEPRSATRAAVQIVRAVVEKSDDLLALQWRKCARYEHRFILLTANDHYIKKFTTLYTKDDFYGKKDGFSGWLDDSIRAAFPDGGRLCKTAPSLSRTNNEIADIATKLKLFVQDVFHDLQWKSIEPEWHQWLQRAETAQEVAPEAVVEHPLNSLHDDSLANKSGSDSDQAHPDSDQPMDLNSEESGIEASADEPLAGKTSTKPPYAKELKRSRGALERSQKCLADSTQAMLEARRKFGRKY